MTKDDPASNLPEADHSNGNGNSLVGDRERRKSAHRDLSPTPESDKYRHDVWDIREMMRLTPRKSSGGIDQKTGFAGQRSVIWPQSPENLDDEQRGKTESGKFLKGKMPSKAERWPTPEEMFDLIDLPGRVRTGQRMFISRLMAQVSQARIAADFNVTNGLVSHWETGERQIGRSTIPRLAKYIRISDKFLDDGSKPTPLWLDPWIPAVQAMADVGIWMAHCGIPPPDSRKCPPGPFQLEQGHGLPDEKSILSRSTPKYEKIISSPLEYAKEFLGRLGHYLQNLTPEAECAWLEQHQDMIEYLPFLPYVWHRLGLIDYAGPLPETRRRKSKIGRSVN
jgi:hypothetical protein